MFWLAAFALTLVASLVVLLPLTGKAGRDLAESEHDLNVYRDQLAEVERDRDRGALGTEEAEEARAEIARRILRADAAGKQEPYVQNKTASRILVSVAVLLVPIISWGMYAALGSPDLP